MLILKILTVLLLLWLMLDDIRYLKVWPQIYPVIAISLCILSSEKQGYFDGHRVLINLFFLIPVLVILTVYLSFRFRRWVNVTNGLLCLADILFLFCAACYLPLYSYITFYTVSLVCAILYATIIHLLRRQEPSLGKQKIPLAGVQAGCLALVLIVGWIYPAWDISDNDTILLALYPVWHNVNGETIFSWLR